MDSPLSSLEEEKQGFNFNFPGGMEVFGDELDMMNF